MAQMSNGVPVLALRTPDLYYVSSGKIGETRARGHWLQWRLNRQQELYNHLVPHYTYIPSQPALLPSSGGSGLQQASMVSTENVAPNDLIRSLTLLLSSLLKNLRSHHETSGLCGRFVTHL